MRVIKDNIHEDFLLPNKTFCPYCNGEMNVATSINANIVRDGDYGLCAGCGEICISVVDEEYRHSLRKPTKKEINNAKQSGMYDMLIEYQQLIRSGTSGLRVKKQN